MQNIFLSYKDDEISRLKNPNLTKTSIYTKISFLPLNLYIQFSKYQNIFFLTVLILLCIPSISPFSPYSYLTALSIVVGASMFKDAIEDIGRHKDDKLVNERPIKVLRMEDNDISESNGFDIKTNYSISENISDPKNHQNNNNKNTIFISPNTLKISKIKSMNIQKNDFIILSNGEELPADGILILSFSSEEKKSGKQAKETSVTSFANDFYLNCIYRRFRSKCRSFAYVETSKIDGETTMKKKYINFRVPKCNCYKWEIIETGNEDQEDETMRLPNCLPTLLKNLFVENDDDEKEMVFLDRELNLNHQNKIKKGTVIKSDNVVVLVTKVEQTISELPISRLTKVSTFSKRLENFLLIVFATFFVFLVLSSVFSSIYLKYPYFFIAENYRGSYSIRLLLTNYVVLSYIVPLSLCVMIEISRLFYQSYCENMLLYIKRVNRDFNKSFREVFRLQRDTDDKITLRNTEVIEQLGNIETIVCDKTGTLTLNEMNFRYFFVNQTLKYENKIFSDQFSDEPENRIKYNIEPENLQDMAHFNTEKNIVSKLFYVLAICSCNSVYMTLDSIEGTSQDELAIIEELKKQDFIKIIFKDDSFLHISFYEISIKLETVAIQEFCSELRRMSVLTKIVEVEHPKKGNKYIEKILDDIKDKYILFTKGSRNSVNTAHLPSVPESQNHLRELHIAFKIVDEKIGDFIKINEGFNEIEDYKIFTDETINIKLEDLTKERHNFIGMTLIEDSLQPNAAQALCLFRSIYIITGDKRTTTVGCAKAIGLDIEWAKRYDEVNESDLKPKEEQDPDVYYYKRKEFYSPPDENLIENVGQPFGGRKSCRIIYNTLPEQKAKLVKEIQKFEDCLAIGDGFNDTAMIREASIGIGISGSEGSAAANVSDVKVTSLRSIIPLIFVSRNAYLGFSYIAINSICKNMLMITVQIIYFFFSNESIYSGSFFTWFNVLFTSMIVFSESNFNKRLAFKIENVKYDLTPLDENIDGDQNFCNSVISSSDCIRKSPTYKNVHKFFSVEIFIFSLFLSILNGVILFFVPYFMFNGFKFFSITNIQILFSYIVFLSVIIIQITEITNLNYYLLFFAVLQLSLFLIIIRGFDILVFYFFEIVGLTCLTLFINTLALILRKKILSI